MGEIKSKKCKVCGKDLVGKKKKFCSKACNDKNYQKMNKKPIIYRKCKFCKIQLKGQQRKYCSKKCSAKYYNKKPKKYKDCMFCGKKFTQKNKRHKCCSIICQRKYYYDNKYRKIIRCKNCIICDNELEKNQQKFCSKKCKLLYGKKYRKINKKRIDEYHKDYYRKNKNGKIKKYQQTNKEQINTIKKDLKKILF